MRICFGFKPQKNHEPRHLKDSDILAATLKIVNIFMNPPPTQDNINSTFSLKVGQKLNILPIESGQNSARKCLACNSPLRWLNLKFELTFSVNLEIVIA